MENNILMFIVSFKNLYQLKIFLAIKICSHIAFPLNIKLINIAT